MGFNITSNIIKSDSEGANFMGSVIGEATLGADDSIVEALWFCADEGAVFVRMLFALLLHS